MSIREVERHDFVDEVHAFWHDRGWHLAADGRALVMELFRADKILDARVAEVLTPLELSFARYEVLMVLMFSASSASRMCRLAELLQVHATSMTNSICRLEDDGLVTRRADPADGRSTVIALTTRGRELAKTATRELNSRVFACVGLERRGVEELWLTLREFRHVSGDF